MPATVTASIGALILSLDDPGRDDFDSVIVWASTTNGFTPGPSNQVFQGKSLTIVIANLAPLVTHYVRFAYVSEIEPGNYVISSQLTGTPNQIAGSLISDGALRGKLLSAGTFADAGTLTTAALTAPANEITTATLNVIDTLDFLTAGGGVIYQPGSLDPVHFRYTGKTATTLTGVSGFKVAIKAGSLVLPIVAPSAILTSYAGSGQINVGKFNFRQAGGSALSVSRGAAMQSFTYTAGQLLSGTYQPTLTGVTGLSNFATTDPVRTIIDNPGFPTFTIASSGSYSTLTLAAATTFLNANGGQFLFASATVTGLFARSYSAYSGTTVTLTASVVLSAGTYTIIPVNSEVVVGLNRAPLVMWSNAFSGLWRETVLSGAAGDVETVLWNSNLYGTDGPALRLYRGPDNTADEPLLFFGSTKGKLQVQANPVLRSSLSPIYSGEFGIVDYNNDGTLAALAIVASGSQLSYYQTISTTVRFNTWDQPADAISFNDTTNVFSFDADGGSGNASILAQGATFSSLTVNGSATFSSITIVGGGSFLNGFAVYDPVVNGSLYGSQIELRAGGVNFTTHSDDFSNAAWSQANITVTTNTSAGPDGLLTLDTITDNATNGAHRVTNGQNITYAGTSAIVSAFLRAGTASRAHIAIRDATTVTNARMVHFDLSAGVILSQGASVQAAGLIPLGGGLFRAWARMTVTTGLNASGPVVGITQPGTDNVFNYVGTGQTIFAGGVQIEEGTGLPSPYTPTGASIVSTPRAAGIDGDTAVELRINGTVIARFDANRFTASRGFAAPGTRSTVATGSTIVAAATDRALLYDQAATVAALTVTLPASPVDGQDFTISTRSAITALTINGGTAYGAPTTLAAGGFCSFKFSSAGAAWFRVG